MLITRCTAVIQRNNQPRNFTSNFSLHSTTGGSRTSI